MTSNADFKRRVRERMRDTGERYTTARAALLTARDETGPGAAPAGRRVGGSQSDLAAAANALAAVGATGVTGRPVDEVDVLGLAGGIGAMYAVFVYEGHGPTTTITTRTVSMPDPFVTEAVGRAGVTYEVRTTGGAATAARTLDEDLAAGHAVLCSVESSGLRHHGGDGPVVPIGPRVVGVLGRDGDHLLLDDRCATPIRVHQDELATARGAARKAKHRSLVLTGLATDHDPVAAARGGLARTVAGYDEPPAKPFANNVGTAGLERWAERLTSGAKDGWARVYAQPAHLHDGLRRVVECVHMELTAPAASRPMFASWLERAGAATGTDLTEQAAAARTSATHWARVAELARSADPAVDAAVAVLEEAQELLDEQGGEAVEELGALRARLPELAAEATLGGADATELFAAMATEVAAIAAVERELVDGIAAALRG